MRRIVRAAGPRSRYLPLRRTRHGNEMLVKSLSIPKLYISDLGGCAEMNQER